MNGTKTIKKITSPDVPEAVVLKQCLDYLHLKGIYCWRNNTGACKAGSRFIRYGYKGSSDILGILPNGKFLAVECKRGKGGVISPEQHEFLSKIQSNGGFAIVAKSVDDLISALQIFFKKM